MTSNLNLPQFDERISKLVKKQYTKNVNCFGIVPYLHGIQDNPIYLSEKATKVYLEENMKPCKSEELDIGDIIILYDEDGMNHVLIMYRKQIAFHKKGLREDCKFVLYSKEDMKKIVKEYYAEKVEFYKCNFEPVEDEKGDIFVNPENKNYKHILQIKNYIGSFLKSDSLYSKENVDPDRFIRDSSVELMKEILPYFTRIECCIIACILCKEERSDHTFMFGVSLSMMQDDDVMKVCEDKDI